jgi:tetratricopeptide (TPR) repeat protein
MSLYRRSVLILSCLGIFACAHPPAVDNPVTGSNPAPNAVAETIAVAERHVEAGRWSAAIDVVERALQKAPDSRRLADALDDLSRRWLAQEQEWEDRIALGNAENYERRIELLEQLSRAAPNDLLVASRRLYWKEVLRGKAEPLLACAERHSSAEPELARRCYRLATDLAEGAEMQARLIVVREQLHESEQLAEQRRRRIAERRRQAEAKVLLGDAKAAIEESDYRRALDVLEKVAELQPDNPEVEALQHSAWSMLNPQIEALVKLGDHLYLDEQLNAAVATWQAAQNLQPDDPDIAARLTRARTVLERLDDLRDKQRPATPAE